MTKAQILTMIYYYEGKQNHTTSPIDLAIIRDTLSLLKKALPTPPRKYYMEGESREICPNKECLDGLGISVYKGELFCSECGQAIEWNEFKLSEYRGL